MYWAKCTKNGVCCISSKICIEIPREMWYNYINSTANCFSSAVTYLGGNIMKHIKTINKANLKETALKGGCGKCQASCQSACKTSCTVANQKCER